MPTMENPITLQNMAWRCSNSYYGNKFLKEMIIIIFLILNFPDSKCFEFVLFYQFQLRFYCSFLFILFLHVSRRENPCEEHTSITFQSNKRLNHSHIKTKRLFSFLMTLVKSGLSLFRGGFRTAETSKMERFVIIVRDYLRYKLFFEIM